MLPAKHSPATLKRKASTPRPPRIASDRLPVLYRALTDQVDDGYFHNAISTCKKILALDPSSIPAFQTLLFLNLHTDDYEAALDLLSKPPSTSPLVFEKAYCLYWLHREKEALVILEGLGERGRKEQQHLEAQIRYRLGEYEKAQELYDSLLAGCDQSFPEYPDILTNLSATVAQSDFLSHSYHSYLNVPPLTDLSGPSGHIPTAGELESYVPSLPTGWALGGLEGVKKAASVKEAKKEKVKGKPRHKLPKGAVAGKPFNEDVRVFHALSSRRADQRHLVHPSPDIFVLHRSSQPDRWLPLRQRSSHIAAMGKKKGAKIGMGTGMTQGSTTAAAASSGAGGGGGSKNKKGKKK